MPSYVMESKSLFVSSDCVKMAGANLSVHIQDTDIDWGVIDIFVIVTSAGIEDVISPRRSPSINLDASKLFFAIINAASYFVIN